MTTIRQVDWADEQASRTDEFQRELQAKTEAMSDLNGEKVSIDLLRQRASVADQWEGIARFCISFGESGGA